MYEWSALVPRLRGLSNSAKCALRSLCDRANGESRQMKLRGQMMTGPGTRAWRSKASRGGDWGTSPDKMGIGLKELLDDHKLISVAYPSTKTEPPIYDVDIGAIRKRIAAQEEAEAKRKRDGVSEDSQPLSPTDRAVERAMFTLSREYDPDPRDAAEEEAMYLAEDWVSEH